MNKKKHFIFLSRMSIIYYCWLGILLFIGLIIAYENVSKIAWLAIIILVIFFLCAVYTFTGTYWKTEFIKFPFTAKKELLKAPKLLKKWGYIKIYLVKTKAQEQIYLLRLEK